MGGSRQSGSRPVMEGAACAYSPATPWLSLCAVTASRIGKFGDIGQGHLTAYLSIFVRCCLIGGSLRLLLPGVFLFVALSPFFGRLAFVAKNGRACGCRGRAGG